MYVWCVSEQHNIHMRFRTVSDWGTHWQSWRAPHVDLYAATWTAVCSHINAKPRDKNKVAETQNSEARATVSPALHSV